MATNQSLLKLRFTSFVVANTTAKESRVKLTVCGITYTVHPDLQWLSDLAEFAKAPPGVSLISNMVLQCSDTTFARFSSRSSRASELLYL